MKCLPKIVLLMSLILPSVGSADLSFKDSVQILSYMKKDGSFSHGSTVAVRREGQCTLLVTAAHVIPEDYSPDKLKSIDHKVDLALIMDCSKDRPKLATISTVPLKEGDRVYGTGYQAIASVPYIVFQYVRVLLEGYYIQEVRSEVADVSLLFASMPSRPGMSGGGLFNARGELIGVIIGYHKNGIVASAAKASDVIMLLDQYDKKKGQ